MARVNVSLRPGTLIPVKFDKVVKCADDGNGNSLTAYYRNRTNVFIAIVVTENASGSEEIFQTITNDQLQCLFDGVAVSTGSTLNGSTLNSRLMG